MRERERERGISLVGWMNYDPSSSMGRNWEDVREQNEDKQVVENGILFPILSFKMSYLWK